MISLFPAADGGDEGDTDDVADAVLDAMRRHKASDKVHGYGAKALENLASRTGRRPARGGKRSAPRCAAHTTSLLPPFAGRRATSGRGREERHPDHHHGHEETRQQQAGASLRPTRACSARSGRCDGGALLQAYAAHAWTCLAARHSAQPPAAWPFACRRQNARACCSDARRGEHGPWHGAPCQERQSAGVLLPPSRQCVHEW